MKSRVVIVAATEPELRGAGPEVNTLVCGVGPVTAAAEVARFLAQHDEVEVVLHVGIAGASRASGLGLLDAVVADSSRYCDTASRLVEKEVLSSSPLVLALDGTHAQRISCIGTSAEVGGAAQSGVQVEAMEGFGVLWAAARAEVAAVEVRVISNWIDEENRSRWLISDALERLAVLTPQLVKAVAGAQL